jgi:hypothetical protein
MEKNIQQSRFSNKRFYSYSVVISLFGAISAIILFFGHVAEVVVTNGLYNKFSADFPEEIRSFLWASESSVKNFASSYIWIIPLGVTIFVFMLLILSYFRNPKRDGKQKYADLLIILFYFILSVTINYLHDAISFSRPINWIMWIAFSAVCGLSSHLLLLHDHLKEKREVDITKLGKDDQQWESLRLEYSEYQSLVHDLIWISGSFGGGLVVTAVLQYAFILPIEISFSNEFGLLVVILLIKVVFLLVGMIVGVVYQLAYEMHNIVDLIRESKKT